MKTTVGHMTIAEICEQMEAKVLVANKVYQRAAGLWPDSAQKYFINTIIQEYPFQPIYVNEYVKMKTRRVAKDVVDGQQRLTTIKSFVDGKLRLGRESGELAGKRFQDLDDETQNMILAYSVPVITITRSSQSEILEMFRRMNSFMVPLNPAEKRHSQFHGKFKLFVARVADEFSPMFHEFGVLTEKQIVRMADAELITDLSDIVARGIKNRQPAMLQNLYKYNDEEFIREEEFEEKIFHSLDFVRSNLSELSHSHIMKSYAFYSLIAGLIHNRWGVVDDNEGVRIDTVSTGRFCDSVDAARRGLSILASAHEEGDVDGNFGAYVDACSSTTHRIYQRTVRTRFVLKALQGQI